MHYYKTLVFQITPDFNQTRADIALTQLALAHNHHSLSRNHIQQLIKQKCVTINSLLLPNRSYRVSAGDILELHIEQYKQQNMQAIPYHHNNFKLDIVFEDDQIAVINKPAGQVVHPAPGHAYGTLSDQLYHHFEGKLSKFNNRPGIVHRLDKDTSGLMLIAKTDQAHNILQQQFEHRLIHKTYLAGVANTRSLPMRFVLECYIGSNSDEKGIMCCKRQMMHILSNEHSPNIFELQNTFTQHPITPNHSSHHHTPSEHQFARAIKPIWNWGKYASMECQVYDSNILICKPHTGRQHQIRAQLKTLKCPIVGDKLYGLEGNQLHLHAFGLKFMHKNQLITVHSDLPKWIH